jgi:hypothetical protein
MGCLLNIQHLDFDLRGIWIGWNASFRHSGQGLARIQRQGCLLHCIVQTLDPAVKPRDDKKMVFLSFKLNF